MKVPLFLLFTLILLGCTTRRNSSPSSPFDVFDTEAHRGGRGLMPENTIPAMLHAISLGVNTLEMDTHITSDGQVIVAHDDYINPAFSLAPGNKEIPFSDANKYALFQMTYAELSRFDVGTKYFAAFPRQKKMAVQMPLLADLIDSVQTYLKRTDRKQVFYNIETKCDESGDHILNPVPSVFISSLMKVIEEKKIGKFVIIQSFDKRTLQELHRTFPKIRTAYLIGDGKKTFEDNLADLGFMPSVYSPEFKLVNKELVEACHKKGIKIVPWTVNTKAEIEALKAMGVDGIISDYTDLLTQ